MPKNALCRKEFTNTELNIKVRTLENEDGSISINAEDVAIGFGWAREKNNKVYVMWDRFNSFINELGFPHKCGKDDYIPESLFYRLGMKANNERAQHFQGWLADDVIPSIRKNGTYMTDEMIEKVLTDPDLIIKLATQLKEEKAARLVAEQKIEEQKPKVAFANAITASTNSILIRELARLISQNGVDMGEKKLYAWMRENGYVEKNSCKATQKAINLKVLELVERTNQDKEGNLHTNFTTYVTPKGQEYFVNKFISKEKQGA